MSPLAGTAAMGKVLDGVSSSTVLRLIKLGLLPAWKGPGRTSPYRVDRAELHRLRDALRAGEVTLPEGER
jgi:hypothetical protein